MKPKFVRASNSPVVQVGLIGSFYNDYYGLGDLQLKSSSSHLVNIFSLSLLSASPVTATTATIIITIGIKKPKYLLFPFPSTYFLCIFVFEPIFNNHHRAIQHGYEPISLLLIALLRFITASPVIRFQFFLSNGVPLWPTN
ncbi:hypothetical protein CDL12_06975 [Handroanthus impetiginosus]|uniref:Uncharacterized protein n=1 Tax=Handroanthus impetiginosus TaxID=429701 RepID=A0A2G9HS42_9LAMI|nr:hypothetical protein CDL12_06975 [Handroanthus impetiginosus]